jgi:hypothetical protein
MIGDELRAQLDALRNHEQVIGLRVDDYTVLIGLVHLVSLKTSNRALAWGRLGDKYGEIAKADQEISDHLNRMVKVLVDGGQRARLDQERHMTMNKIRNALMGILLFALMALLIGAPAGLISLAQDATPSEEAATLVVTEPVPTLVLTAESPVFEPGPVIVDTTEIPNYVMTFILVFVLALILLFGAVLVLLYRSVPAVFQSGINATLVKLFEKMQEMVAATPTKIDDALAAEIERRVWERINEASKPTLAVDIGEARAKLLAGLYRQENEGGVG